MNEQEQLQRLQQRLERERAARQEAERVLEVRSRELYDANCELADATRQLEARVAARTRELAQALQRAENSERAKTEFLAVMSHQLRTPMNGVQVMAQLLADTPLSTAQHDMLHTLQDSANSMLTLINDLLDLTALHHGQLKLELRDFNLLELVDSVANHARSEANQKGLSLWLERPTTLPWLHGDPERLRQAMLNLLSNAVKFTDEGEIRITVSAERLPAGEARIGFAVHDDGIGISEAQQARLFQALEPADSSLTRRHGGSGMGLAISQYLATAMNGHIAVQSRPGEGSCFTLYWQAPVVVPPVPITPVSEVVLPPATLRLRILIAEDNLLNQRLIQKMLERLGIRDTRLAADGHEAVQAVQNGDVDLVLMDMQMPQLDGIGATHAIRALALSRQPDIVALTANAFEEDRNNCLAAGMDDFLSKPIRLDLLANTLCRAEQGHYQTQRSLTGVA